MRQVHVPYEPLWRYMRQPKDGAAAERLGVSRRTILRWKKIGLTICSSDQAAIAIGAMPHEIWPEVWSV